MNTLGYTAKRRKVADGITFLASSAKCGALILTRPGGNLRVLRKGSPRLKTGQGLCVGMGGGLHLLSLASEMEAGSMSQGMWAPLEAGKLK